MLVVPDPDPLRSEEDVILIGGANEAAALDTFAITGSGGVEALESTPYVVMGFGCDRECLIGIFNDKPACCDSCGRRGTVLLYAGGGLAG
jgi:hypothetical protein